MKLIILSTATLILQLCTLNSFAQQAPKPYKQTQTFISIGISKPFLKRGNELLESKYIRSQGLSYFENNNEERATVGAYSRLIGWNIGLGFYNPFKKIDKLMWGAELNLSLTGSTPSEGFEEAYYFNYISFNFGIKYYPITAANLFIKTNVGLGAAMTKNRFINDSNEQNFLHQFGLGINGIGAIGYTFPLITKLISAIELSTEYKFSTIRVEVNGIGNDIWSYSALDFKVGFLF